MGLQISTSQDIHAYGNMASEAATLRYLRAHSDILVPWNYTTFGSELPQTTDRLF